MTVEIYDAAQRRYAASTGVPVWRVAHALIRPRPDAVAVRETGHRGQIVLARRGGAPVTVSGGQALDALAVAGVVMDRDTPPQVFVADPATVGILAGLARVHAGADDPMRASAAEAVAWCTERADFPGTSALVDLTAVSAVALVAGVPPSRDRIPATWHAWLDLPADRVAATFAWADALADRPAGLPELLDVVLTDDTESWERRRAAVAGGWCHTLPEGLSHAAVGLRTRCDTADLWEAALLSDPKWRRRAVHTGHVVVGTAERRTGVPGFLVTADRIDARMSAGTEITGWAGDPDAETFGRFFTAVRSAAVVDGRLVLTCDKTARMPGHGDPVTLTVAPPNPSLHTSVRINMWAKYKARGSWIARADTPTLSRRDVPLEVMIAAAEDE
ncbi:hypothetical protein ACTHRK_16690 [Dietzia cercidiphylli]|uniref:hypothetical protein n=1 Tax=Dietzia cercidiphylli TaxID=498199 RepID=UPI003F7D5F90